METVLAHRPYCIKVEQTSAERQRLALVLAALANPTRLSLLERLAHPAYVAALAAEFDITRQAMRKHLTILHEAGLVRATPSRHGALPALLYAADPAALFLARERLHQVVPAGASAGPRHMPTLAAPGAPAPDRLRGAGIVVLHGADAPGRFVPLRPASGWIVGRADDADVRLAHDPYVSTRHAMLRYAPSGWTIEDLGSTNGTFLDFRRLPPGAASPLPSGAIVTAGRTHFVLRGGA